MTIENNDNILLDIKRLLTDYGISYSTEGENVGDDWIGINCPFCDDELDHGGFNLSETYYNCWRCGSHSLKKVFRLLFKVSNSEIKRIFKQYKITYIPQKEIKKEVKKEIHSIKFPVGIDVLQKQHIDYLFKRGFKDPYRLADQWNLMGTGPLGDYKFRIIAPIYYENKIVSYQGRDITDRQILRYKPCYKNWEIIHHKDILYGLNKVTGRKVIVTEGITDVWKIGSGTLATFGIQFTMEQIKILSNFDYITILFDCEPQARQQAYLLGMQLKALGKEIIILNINKGDPAELLTYQIDELRKKFL